MYFDFSKHTLRPLVDICFMALPGECLYYISVTPFKLMNRPLYNQLVTYYELIEGRDWQSEIKLITSILKRSSLQISSRLRVWNWIPRKSPNEARIRDDWD